MRIHIPDDHTELKEDLAYLQFKHGIDDSLLESLLNAQNKSLVYDFAL